MKQEESCKEKNMHYENNDFMHERKIKEGKRGWIVVHFYKFDLI